MAIGIVPARMGSGRFPGKPLHPILGRTLLEHCYLRASLWGGWDALYVGTPDDEIAEYARSRGWPVVITRGARRALDCVALAAAHLGLADGVVVNVQGDEPMLDPGDIGSVVSEAAYSKSAVVLGLEIEDPSDPNLVKIVRSGSRFVYSSRSVVPHGKGEYLRIGGVFAFPMNHLAFFAAQDETPLEARESCDMNRAVDLGIYPRVVVGKGRGQSVDCPEDVKTVESLLPYDPWWGRY